MMWNIDLTDPPYNVLHSRDDEVLENDWYLVKNKSCMMWLSRAIMKVWCPGCRPCMALPYGQWNWLQAGKSEDFEILLYYLKQLLQGSRSQVSPELEVDSILLQYVWTVGTHQKSLNAWKAYPSKVWEYASHSCRMGVSYWGLLGKLVYWAQDEMWTTHP